MSNVIEFKDLNFKLAVIQVLMYEKEIIKPAIDAYEFADDYEKREIDIDEEGYEPIPEILEYFKNLEILDSQVQDIEELCQDGGDEVYMAICPFWSGEDEIFTINSVEDADLLPNLKKVTLFGNNLDVFHSLKEKGIVTEHV